MHPRIHLILAITSSMIITFGFYHVMRDLPTRDSVFQHVVIDFCRDAALLLRCTRYERRSPDICSSFFLDEEATRFLLTILVIYLTVALALFYSGRIVDHCLHVMTIVCCVELLGRCLDFVEISDQIDLVTIYFVVWQVICVVWTWMWRLLPSPILLIEQAATCIFLSATAFTIHHCLFRYVPREVSLASFWILSVGDIFVCLHPRGRQRILCSSKARSDVEMGCSGAYYTGTGGGKRGAVLGFGDILLYNVMLLLALPASPSSSMITQLSITGGSIISITIGFLLTGRLLDTYRLQVAPGLPLPVMTFTTYVILLKWIVVRC